METAHTAVDAAPAPPPVVAAGDDGLLASAQALWQDLRGALHDHLQLAALEAQRAGKSLVNMVIYGIAAAILVVSAWLGLMAAGVFWLIGLGLHPSLALLAAVGVNVGGVVVLVLLILRASHYLGFPATVRSLKAVKSDASLAVKSDASLPARKEA